MTVTKAVVAPRHRFLICHHCDLADHRRSTMCDRRQCRH
jgi:hypothetical protein